MNFHTPLRSRHVARLDLAVDDRLVGKAVEGSREGRESFAEKALVGLHIRKGNFGNLALDGLDFIYAASWPRAMYTKGDGTMRLYITDRATEPQRAGIPQVG